MMSTKQFCYRVISITAVMLSVCNFCVGDELLQTKMASVQAGNYTFFKVRADGYLRIELVPVLGDADLYVSDVEKEPRFNSYRLQSCTCGTDSVEIPPTFKRPISVGVYGHPRWDTSKFHLSVFIMPKPEELTYHQFTLMLNNFEAIDKLMYGSEFGPRKNTNSQSSSGYSNDVDEDEDEGSVVWQILITVLKVIVEIML